MAGWFLVLLATCASVQSQMTIPDVLKSLRMTTLLDLIDTAGLTSDLQTAGPFTVFAPSSAALLRLGTSQIIQLKANPTALADIIKYHVVSGNVTYADLTVNEKMLESLTGLKIRVNYYHTNRHVAVEGVHVGYIHDRHASNGIVHVIDDVMMPPNGTIVDILAMNPQFSTLKQALEAVQLTDALADGPYTLFAPNNQAFAALGNGTVSKLLANTDLLKNILLYHVTHGTLYSTGMHSGSLLHNLEQVDQERLVASFGGAVVSVDGARVVNKDMSAVNGVVHELNHVMIPLSLQDQVKNL